MDNNNGILDKRVSTGIEGLDAILGGGFPANRVFLLEGNPGAGKTTLAMQFLLEGARCGETSLFITLSETKSELEMVARSHGWSLDGIHIFDLAIPENDILPDTQYTLYHPSEVELGETTKAIFEQVERLKPTRIVLDSLAEMRLQARDPLRYRRQVLALKQYFITQQSTVLFLDDHTSESDERPLESIVHGVILLVQTTPGYGGARRHLSVLKMRGVKYHSGNHDFCIESGGIVVFPRLKPTGKRKEFDSAPLSSGVSGLDELTGGGLHPGTATLLLGPAGTGKSTIAAQFGYAAAERGQKVAFFIFDEDPYTLFMRTQAVGIDLEKHVQSGHCTVKKVDPAELTVGEFSTLVRRAVEDDGANIVIIDSMNGYFQAMPEERFLIANMHELLSYLGQQGALTMLVLAQHGIVGTSMPAPIDLTYLSDTVLLFRYFEALGEVKQAISVVKKRTGGHERAIREYRITTEGIQVGEPLREFQGVLTGVPRYVGGAGPLLTGANGNTDQ